MKRSKANQVRGNHQIPIGRNLLLCSNSNSEILGGAGEMGAEVDALYEIGRHATGSHEIPCVSVEVEPVHSSRFCIYLGGIRCYLCCYVILATAGKR